MPTASHDARRRRHDVAPARPAVAAACGDLLGAFVALELSEPGIAMLLGVERRRAAAFDPASSAPLAAIPTNLLLLHGLGLHDRLTWNIPSWSISAEFWTYVRVRAGRSCWRGAGRIGAGGLLVGCLAGRSVGVSNRYIGVDYDLGFFRCIVGFFVGHLVFRLVEAVPVRLPMPTLVEAGRRRRARAVRSLGAGSTPFEFAAPLVFGVVVWSSRTSAGRFPAC